MTTEPQRVRAGCFTAKIKCEEEGGRQSKLYGSHLVVHRVAFPACVKFMSRQGVIL